MQKVQRSLSSTLIHYCFFLFGFRLYIQSAFPVIGDEAYYFYWGHHFAGGYYDLPPMIGWWERFFTAFSDESFWLRLPNLLVMLAVTYGMREWLSTAATRGKATTTSLLYLLSPVPFLAVMITHDVALLFFTFFSALLFYRGYQVKNSWKEFLFFWCALGRSFFIKVLCAFCASFLFDVVFYS
jgi:4-amino-4-deoxy-L-arabinose transferase-like glycosyltransferase